MQALTIVVIIISVIIIGLFWRRKQKEARRRVAMELGFAFHDTVDSVIGDLRPAFVHIDLFKVTGADGIDLSWDGGGILEGDFNGNGVFVFNYQHEDQEQTVACFRQRRLDFPSFKLSPKRISDKITFSSEKEAIGLPSSPDFSKNYKLETLEEEAARALFDWDTITYLGQSKGWTVESRRGWFVIYRYRHIVKPRHIPVFLEDAKRICTLLVRD